jgi:hypothetical protein
MTTKLINQALLTIKILIVLVCLLTIFSTHWPPKAQAQKNTPRLTVPVITVEDAMQDDHIEQLNKHIEATDANVTKLMLRSEEQENAMSSYRGGIQVALWIIGALSTGGIVLQLKQKSTKE